MKLKIIITAMLILFSMTTYAFLGCVPESQIYINITTQTEKYLACGEMLNKFTSFPLTTTSFVESKKAYVFGSESCGGKDILNLQLLNFSDFSIFDKIKITINALFFLIIILTPLGLPLLIYRRIKSPWGRISFDIIFTLLYLAWIFLFFGLYGTC